MKRSLILLFILGIVFLIGCSKQEVVECPVVEEKECATIECPECEECASCEAQVKEVVKYVCPDEKEVDSKEDCFKKPEVIFTPITTNEEGTIINSVIVKPSCVKGINGGQAYYDLGANSDSISFQVKEKVEEGFWTVYSAPTVTKKYVGFGICNGCSIGDFQLEPESQYLFRIEFDLTNTFGKKIYSNEHVIDTRTDSEYMAKECSSY